jgi:hypothetical protein
MPCLPRGLRRTGQLDGAVGVKVRLILDDPTGSDDNGGPLVVQGQTVQSKEVAIA